jgi:uncharacterized protein
MSITMYSASVPIFTQTLSTLSQVLDKAELHAKKQKVEPLVLLNMRLYPDMYPLINQVQFTCDFAKGAAARLAGVAVPSYDDNETTFEDLRARIAKTLAFIQSVDAASMDGSEDRDIALNFGGRQLKFKGREYLVGFAIPSMVFHMTTAYAILRHNGVELGKADFLGELLERGSA